MRLRKRYRWALAVVGAFGLLVGVMAVVVYPWPQGRYTRAQYDRIRLGMTKAEVEAILGSPRKETTRKSLWRWETNEGKMLPDFFEDPAAASWWADDGGEIGVAYDAAEGGRVKWKGRFVPSPDPIWQRWRWRRRLRL